jgi:hypothetical protein
LDPQVGSTWDLGARKKTTFLIKMEKKIQFFGWFSFFENQNENKFLKP